MTGRSASIFYLSVLTEKSRSPFVISVLSIIDYGYVHIIFLCGAGKSFYIISSV